jgi:hypothetical protein
MAIPAALTPGTTSVLTNQQERTDTDAGGALFPRVLMASRDGQRVAPVAQLFVAPTTSPATLTASTSTSYVFPVTEAGLYALRWVYIENNSDAAATPANVYVGFDATAVLGGFKIRPGEVRCFPFPVQTTVQLLSSQALAVNGASDGGVVLVGGL